MSVYSGAVSNQLWSAWTVGVLGLLWPAAAAAAPPIASVSATTDVATTGDEVGYDASGSFDLDDDPLTFAWDFDDGTTATGPVVAHRFERPGAYRVRVVVHDGTSSAEAGVTTRVLPPPGPPTHASSAIVAWGARVVVHVPALAAAVVVEVGRATALAAEGVIAIAAGGADLWLAQPAQVARWNSLEGGGRRPAPARGGAMGARA